MTDELKALIQERNRLRRDRTANRAAWVEKGREVVHLTQVHNRRAWRAHLQNIAEKKDATRAWSVVICLNGNQTSQTRRTLVHNGREYVSEQAKTSAFVQEYAAVSG